MSQNDTLLNHPTLNCTLRGRLYPDTIQYRNLKYAEITGRWRDSTPLDTIQANSTDRIYDARHFGASCPQKRGAQAWDLTLVGDAALPAEEGQGDSELMDELECLHVNVTIPRSASRHRSPLPVFVWVHGGGLSIGSNSWPQYDLQKLVARSVEIGDPIIGVSINYRVGILGFLASEEVGATGNYGFKDQVLAFRWIKRHIEGFGGDSKNITAAGESAGGISLSTILCANTGNDALFDKVVLMSGDATLRKSRARQWHEAMYEDQIKMLGLERLDKESRVRQLRSWNAIELCQRLPLAQHFCALVDGHWLKADITLNVLGDGRNEMHKPQWCRERVVGDTAHDGTVLKARIVDRPSSLLDLHALCAKYLTAEETGMILEAYRLPRQSMGQNDQDAHVQNLLELASDLRFYLPCLKIYEGWLSAALPQARSYRYHFHIPNTVHGLYEGLASHELDVAYLLQNWNDVFDKRNRKLAHEMADNFIKFVQGRGFGLEDVARFSDKVTVFTEDGIESRNDSYYDAHWRSGRGKMLQSISAERLWALADEWQGVRPETSGNRDARKSARL